MFRVNRVEVADSAMRQSRQADLFGNSLNELQGVTDPK